MVARDSISVASGVGNLSTSSAPVAGDGEIKAVKFKVVINASTSQITSVVYGGVNIPAVAGSPVGKATGEALCVAEFFLGEGVPQGVQAWTVTVSGGAAKLAECHLFTDDESETIEIVDIKTINSDSIADPRVTLALDGRDCYCDVVFFSGQNAITGISEIPGGNWTVLRETNVGGVVSAGIYAYNIVSNVDVSAGWNQTAEDGVGIATAISGVYGSGTVVFGDCAATQDESVAEPDVTVYALTEAEAATDESAAVDAFVINNNDPFPPIVSINQGASATVAVGSARQLTTTVDGNPEPTLAWSSNNELIATVSPTGLVTAVAEGSCVVTVEATNTEGVDDDTITINVIPPPDGVLARPPAHRIGM